MNSVNLIGGSKSIDSDELEIKRIMLNKQYFQTNGGGGGNDRKVVVVVDDNNQTSQELACSSTNGDGDGDELHWCPDLDYQLSCDNTFRPSKTDIDDGSQISFTMANSGTNSNKPFMNDAGSSGSSSKNRNNQNFDIHLAQIDIETFKSEDIRRIRFDQSMNASNDDTLRIVDSISSFTANHLLPPKEEDCEALSIDSLDISVDNESINSELIQKCSENDKTRYKIAMIESQMNQSQLMNNNNRNPFNMSGYQRSNNMQQSHHNSNANANEQSPGSLMKMFIQNRNSSVENSFDAKNHANANGSRNELNSFTTEEANDESTGNSLNTIDSNELPLHVLDLSKKLRSLSLNKQQQQQQQAKYGFSTSVSSNTSFTSTTTSSSATNDKRNHHRHHNMPTLSTNPFLNICKENVMTKCAGTQFPDVQQDKEVQASFEDCTPIKDAAPVLVYYPNYSLPDLSFLQEIFAQDSGHEQHHPVYLSPVKHEPVKVKPENSVRLRTNTATATNNVNVVNHNHNDHHGHVNGQKKCRPKSYTDYEAILNQDLSHIKDWDSLNLLLPDDFKEFIEQNNLLKLKTRNPETNNNGDDHEQTPRNSGIQFLPPKTMLPNHKQQRLFQNVKLRPHSVRNLNYHQNSPSKRFSLQEHNLDQNNINNYNHNYHQYPNHGYQEFMNEPAINSFMIRSQTMPNCQMAFNHHAGNCYPHMPAAPPPPPPRYHNCCCHSGCHSPSLHASQSSPQKNNNNNNNNFNWDSISSSNSFKKLISFLSKLDEYSSSHSDSTNTEVPEPKESEPPNPMRKNVKHSQTFVDNTETFENASRASRKTSKHRTGSSRKSGFKNFEQNSTVRSKTVNIQTTAAPAPVSGPTTKNSSDKTKIVLKRPTSLNKSGHCNSSGGGNKHHHQQTDRTYRNSTNTGIPLPKRLSSGIPVLHKQNTQPPPPQPPQNHNSGHHYHQQQQQQQFGRGSSNHQNQHYRNTENNSNRF